MPALDILVGQPIFSMNSSVRSIASSAARRSSASVAGDRAHATCYLLEYMTENGEAKLLTPGEYDCDLMRVSGKWLFSERRITLDQPFPIML